MNCIFNVNLLVVSSPHEKLSLSLNHNSTPTIIYYDEVR